MLGVLIIAILTGIAVPAYNSYIDSAKNKAAMRCILEIEVTIARYYSQNSKYPASLGDITLSSDCNRDPWGNPYRYLNIADQDSGGVGGYRKDRFENPLNGDYDLYSMGKDGETNQSLRPKASHDDIIRAKNGGYVGLAADY